MTVISFHRSRPPTLLTENGTSQPLDSGTLTDQHQHCGIPTVQQHLSTRTFHSITPSTTTSTTTASSHNNHHDLLFNSQYSTTSTPPMTPTDTLAASLDHLAHTLMLPNILKTPKRSNSKESVDGIKRSRSLVGLLTLSDVNVAAASAAASVSSQTTKVSVVVGTTTGKITTGKESGQSASCTVSTSSTGSGSTRGIQCASPGHSTCPRHQYHQQHSHGVSTAVSSVNNTSAVSREKLNLDSGM
ncbi:hypothetical protein HDU76_002078 [Blyttiomyces sp. JEL0837]|nr:hypothetical protein HDU76_002078 [Blyttiomyces sp. JEL0837]